MTGLGGFTELDAFAHELAPVLGAPALEELLRRVARRAGAAAAAGGGPHAALEARPELPLARHGEAYRCTTPGTGASQRAWLAGFLEGADPQGRAVVERAAPEPEFHYLEQPAADDDGGFHLPASGPLSPLQLAQVADLSDDALFFVDRDRRIRSWNRGAEAMFGYRAEEAVGQYFDLLVPDDLRAQGELDRIEAETARTGTLRHYQTRRRARDGRELLVSLTRTRILAADGSIAGHGIVLRDVSAEVQLRHQLEAARKLAQLGEVATQVAHEVRNPLAGIHGALQVLRRRLQPDPEASQVFDEIALEIARLDRIVNDLLRLGRPATPRLQRVDLADWLEQWLRRMAGDAEHRRARMSFEARARPHVDIDPVFLEQVLRNLFDNAVEAITGPPRIRLLLEADARSARVWFRDNGPGIPEALRERALQPFFSTKVRGTGLGLPICKSLLAALGASLEVHSNDPGAVLCLLLPLAQGS